MHSTGGGAHLVVMVKGLGTTEEMDAVCFPCPRGERSGRQRATLRGREAEGAMLADIDTIIKLREHGDGGFTIDILLGGLVYNLSTCIIGFT